MSSKKWIQEMHMDKGGLHKALGIPMDKKIPAKVLAKAAKKGGKVGRQARLVQTLEHMHK